MNILSKIHEFRLSESNLESALYEFEFNDKSWLPDQKVELKTELIKLFRNAHFRYKAFDALIKLDIEEAWSLIYSFYLDINLVQGRSTYYLPSELSILLESMISVIDKVELLDRMKNPSINLQILKSIEVSEILIAVFSESEYNDLISLRENSKKNFSLNELICKLDELLDNHISREDFKEYANKLYCDFNNDLLVFKNENLEKFFSNLIVQLTSVDLIFENQYLYSNDDLENQLDQLKEFI